MWKYELMLSQKSQHKFFSSLSSMETKLIVVFKESKSRFQPLDDAFGLRMAHGTIDVK